MILLCCGDLEGDPTFRVGGGLAFPPETAGIPIGGDVTAVLRLSF